MYRRSGQVCPGAGVRLWAVAHRPREGMPLEAHRKRLESVSRVGWYVPLSEPFLRALERLLSRLGCHWQRWAQLGCGRLWQSLRQKTGTTYNSVFHSNILDNVYLKNILKYIFFPTTIPIYSYLV